MADIEMASAAPAPAQHHQHRHKKHKHKKKRRHTHEHQQPPAAPTIISPTAAMRKTPWTTTTTTSSFMNSAYFERKDIRAKVLCILAAVMGIILAVVAGSYSSTAIIIGGIVYGMLAIGIVLPFVGGILGLWVSSTRRAVWQLVFCILMGILCVTLSVVVVNAFSTTDDDVSEKVDQQWATMTRDERNEWNNDRETLKNRVDKHLTGLRLTGTVTLLIMIGAVWSVHLLRREIAWETEMMEREKHNKDEFNDKLVARQMEARRVQIHLEATFQQKAPTAQKYATLGIVSSQSRENTTATTMSSVSTGEDMFRNTPQQRAHTGSSTFSTLLGASANTTVNTTTGDEVAEDDDAQRARERAERRRRRRHNRKEQHSTGSTGGVVVTGATPISPVVATTTGTRSAPSSSSTKKTKKKTTKKDGSGRKLPQSRIIMTDTIAEEKSHDDDDEKHQGTINTLPAPAPAPLLAPLTFDEDDGVDAPFTPSPEPAHAPAPQFAFTDPPPKRPTSQQQRPPLSPLQRRRAGATQPPQTE